MVTLIQSPRLQLRPLRRVDLDEVFQCITPTITRFLPWEPPRTLSAFKELHEKRLQIADENNFTFVVRRRDTMACLGLTSLEGVAQSSPEVGIWLKETAHGLGFGYEAVKAVVDWAHTELGKTSFIYPVAAQNSRSRRIAEKLRGELIGSRTNPKYDSVVYKIPWAPEEDASAPTTT